ncbi:MAG TPA: DUF3341 domain-containing protein [Myxococcaceae bacterium]|nr:DUF3341 domain-containing protein [Myxococcaceae bacterium]
MKRWILGEFTDPDTLLAATRKVREAGATDMDTYSPYPLHGAEEALGLGRSKVPLFCLVGALAGLTLGYLMQFYLNAVDYPINIGNRPIHSAPTNIPITFELAILLAAFSIFGGLLFYLCKFPQPHHPAFELEAFRSASTHGYWVSVIPRDANQEARVVDQLKALGAAQVSVVEEPEE